VSEFFHDPSVLDLAQTHADQVEGLKTAEMERILKLYKQVRQDLRDRLEVTARGTFTAQQQTATLVQVEAAIEKMQSILQGEMRSSSEIIAGTGVDQFLTEYNKWDSKFSGAAVPIDLDVARIAADSSNFLFNKHEASLDAYSSDLRSGFASMLSNAVVANASAGQVVQRSGLMFMDQEWKLTRLVRTELHSAYNLGKINGMIEARDEFVSDLKKTLFHPLDARTGKDSKRLIAHNLITDIDKEFVDHSLATKNDPHKVVRYMAPPNRPNDRSILIPFRQEWTES
jgi:hypothetical protein